MILNKQTLCAVCLAVLPQISSADIITFDFTGRVTVMDSGGGIVGGAGGGDDDGYVEGSGSSDPYGLQASIHSTFTYDTVAGFGSGDLIISPLTYIGLGMQFHSISMDRIEGTNYVLGNMLVDFGPTSGIPVSLVWDGTGLLNAIDYGLLAGDIVSGTNLIRDGETVFDVNSAVPASDGYEFGSGIYTVNQGPAPLATTNLNTTTLCTPGVDCIGNTMSGGLSFFDDGIAGSPLIDGPFTSLQLSIDIGSGNSLTVLNVSSVPIPSAVWLFGSGLIGLIGVARRKKV